MRTATNRRRVFGLLAALVLAGACSPPPGDIRKSDAPPEAGTPVGPIPGDKTDEAYPPNPFADDRGAFSEGRRLFTEKRCVVCHQVAGIGGVIGPSLDFLGQYGSPIFVAAAMWNHGPAMAEVMRFWSSVTRA